MSVSALGSFFSRFAVKFIEVIGAGVATAVTGYLLAHFSGYWSSPVPAPAAVQVAPSTSVVSKSQRAQPAQALSASAKEQRFAPAQDVSLPAMQPARTIVKANQALPSRKHMTTDASATESKPREVERDMQAVEAQVRAALANVDATRPAPPDAMPHAADIPPAPPAVATQPRPADSPVGPGAIAVVPRADDLTPPPMQQAPAESEPLPTVEIKSRPVAAVEASPAPPAKEKAQENVQENVPENAQVEDKSLLSAIKKIPDLFRPKAAASDGEAPRPPLPVGD
jgi:hypothetical protein